MIDAARTSPAGPFGTCFAERMAIAHYRDGAWSEPAITPLAPLALHPGAHALHYASSCFEGLKAFRGPDAGVQLFRPGRHAERMRRSAELLCLPFPGTGVIEEMVVDLVAACADDVPEFPSALYLRPTLLGTEAHVGAAGAPPAEACCYVLACPVGDYFGDGLHALRVQVEEEHPRTTPDFGMAKAGANYASALRHVVRARQTTNADTVLFCPGGDVQETGASNFLLLDDREVVTRPLDGSFLHGVTRDSVLALARDLGYRVSERRFGVDEMLAWCARGEAAVSGTAAVLGGVGCFIRGGREHRVGDGAVGPNTRRLREALLGIQSGRDPDRFGWLRPVGLAATRAAAGD